MCWITNKSAGTEMIAAAMDYNGHAANDDDADDDGNASNKVNCKTTTD